MVEAMRVILPVLHELQQGLLLLFIEILDLIQVEQHPVPGASKVPTSADDLLECPQMEAVVALSRCRVPVGPLGDDVGHRGLAGARGAVKDQVGHV